jgi:2-oxoglutarate dehydrogenase E2 component (dihydrolipoamide succinyltransferase)
MPAIEIVMPAMGEGIIEATLIKWLKNEGDAVNVEENLVEVATDKVNSEVPSAIKGILVKKLFQENEVVPVGKPFALVSTDGSMEVEINHPEPTKTAAPEIKKEPTPFVETAIAPATIASTPLSAVGSEDAFYSPLVLNIAKEEGISMGELSTIKGTGNGGRVTKNDILAYLKIRGTASALANQSPAPIAKKDAESNVLDIKTSVKTDVSKYGSNVEVVEMDRMRKLIADYMVKSLQISAHVSSFVEVDMTNIVTWRNKMKGIFKQKYGENLTFMPIFVEAIVKAIKDFPIINSSVDGDNIIIKKDINIGIAAALPSGNLIVPVVKHADQLNLLGLCKQINDLANRARLNKLKPEEIQGGTYTLSNLGTFGNLLGTPIINQPQVAIMAVGAITKKPVVIENEEGDFIGIRSMMYLSHSYDHRVIDGYAGGSFVKRVAHYLESFDVNREV